MKIIRTEVVHKGENLSNIRTYFTNFSHFIFFVANDRTQMRCLPRSEVTDNGRYVGSFNPGQWSATLNLSDRPDGRNPTIAIIDDDPVAIWEGAYGLLCAPTSLRRDILSAEVTLTDELTSEGFSFALSNLLGKYTRIDSDLAEMLASERKAALYLGYDGEFVKILTAEIDTDDADKQPEDQTIMITTLNKYADLLGMDITKTYGAQYTAGARQAVITMFKVDKIGIGKQVEVKVAIASPDKRWHPTSPQIANFSPVLPGLTISRPYGGTETFCFVRITNNTTQEVEPTFDVTACLLDEQAEKVGEGSISIGEGETTGNTFVNNLSIECDTQSYYLVITDIDYPEGWDWTWGGGGGGGRGDGPHWTPQKKKIIYYANYKPQIYLFDPQINGLGVQVVFDHGAEGGTVTVHFQVWGRPQGTVVGDYFSAVEILEDIIGSATKKKIIMASREGKMKAGQTAKQDFVNLGNEPIELSSVIMESISATGVNLSLMSVTYTDYGETVAEVMITRTENTGIEADYSYEIWGNYSGKTDVLAPLQLEITDPPTLDFTAPVAFKDETMLDAIAKIKQVCFAEDGAGYRIFMGPNNDIRMKPYRIGSPAWEFLARNISRIRKTSKAVPVIDRVEVKGIISQPEMMTTEEELLQSEVKVDVPAGKGAAYATIKFENPVDPNSLRLVVTSGQCGISERNPYYCKVRVENRNVWTGGDSGKFELWGKYYASVRYQEDIIIRTNPNATGKYQYVTAEVENELIQTEGMALQMADAIINESQFGRLTLAVEGPAHPGLEPLDTVTLKDEEMGVDSDFILKGVAFRFDANDGVPELTMNPTFYPVDDRLTGPEELIHHQARTTVPRGEGSVSVEIVFDKQYAVYSLRQVAIEGDCSFASRNEDGCAVIIRNNTINYGQTDYGEFEIYGKPYLEE